MEASRGVTARRVLGRSLGVAIVAGAVATSAWAWWLSYRHPRTDDATVRANLIGVAPHVEGPIVELPLVDNQPVERGELLFVVDPRPYLAELERRRAELAVIDKEIAATRAAIAAAEAEVEQREADARYAATHLRRLEPLLAPRYVTADRVEDARSRKRSTAAALQRARAEVVRQQELLAEVGDLNARRLAAEAAVRDAELDVGYCRVRAPFDGYVTNLNISVGEYARRGQQVFTLVDRRNWYVMANFRETYLDSIRPGMAADVYLLAYPERRFRGRVQGIGWAVMDPDGPTLGGVPFVQKTLNWVRLAQRFPVRIVLEESDPARPFRTGATAVVTIRGDPEEGP